MWIDDRRARHSLDQFQRCSSRVIHTARKCIHAATARQLAQWVCLGGTLQYTDLVAGRQSQPAIRTEQIASDPVMLEDPPPPANGAVAPTDDYDTWCEFGSVCHRAISDYIAETKGNAGYGNSRGAIGSFDVILRTNLNGRQPQ